MHGNCHLLPFPQCFQPFTKQISVFVTYILLFANVAKILSSGKGFINVIIVYSRNRKIGAKIANALQKQVGILKYMYQGTLVDSDRRKCNLPVLCSFS